MLIKGQRILEEKIFMLKHYKSGYSVFKNYPLIGVGNKNYRVETKANHLYKKKLYSRYPSSSNLF